MKGNPSILKLVLDIVPSSSADISRALGGCYRGGSVYVSFRFVSFQRKGNRDYFMESARARDFHTSW